MINNKKEKYFAFSLAEVLIVIGILGIVAGLAIPKLHYAYKKHLVESRLKWTVATLSELAKRVQNEEGDFYALYEGTKGSYNERSVAFHKILKKYIKADACSDITSFSQRSSQRRCFMDATKDFSLWQGFNAGEKLVLPNGIGFEFYNINSEMGIVNVDLNISPHRMNYGVDYFKLIITSDGRVTSVNNGSLGYLFKCNSIMRGSNSEVKTSVSERCKNPGNDDYQGYAATYCAALIECNGWKIPKDYPIVF